MSIKCKGIFIVGAKRTPFCKHGGSLRDLPSSHIFAAAAKDALQSAKLDPELVDNTVVGNIHFLSQCDGGKTPRYCGIFSGIPISRPALGVNRSCGTGIQAVISGTQDILTGMAKASLTGGTENMSSLPSLVRNVRFGTSLASSYEMEDYIKKERPDSFVGKTMQKLAEDLAMKYGVTRDMIEEYAMVSHLRWKAAQASNTFAEEISPITVTINKKDILIDRDQILQDESDVRHNDGSVITNAVPADGASAILLANSDTVNSANLQPLARVSGWASVGVAPADAGLGAAAAARSVLGSQGLTVDHVDLFEINDTFASQVLVTMKELNIDPKRVNIDGGALSLGHPESATGVRMVTHLAHQIQCGVAKKAIAASSCGGGQGVALLLERI